jgi:alkylation response protein AidB-like acyl-CoA dehydrogenase
VPDVVRAPHARRPDRARPALWRRLVELGWTGLLVPEAYGGLGASFVELLVVLEETGRALLPGPFFATIAAATALVEGGSPTLRADLLPRLARGELLLSLAIAEADGRFDPDGVGLPARAAPGGYELRGTKHFVPDAHVADPLVVAARTSDGDALRLGDRSAPGVALAPVRTVDMTRRVHRVDFRDVSVPGTRLLGAPLSAARSRSRPRRSSPRWWARRSAPST